MLTIVAQTKPGNGEAPRRRDLPSRAQGVEVIQDGNSVPAGKPQAKINSPTFISLKLFSKEFKELKTLLTARAGAELIVGDTEAQGVPVNVNMKRTRGKPGLTVIITILLPLFYLSPQSQVFSNPQSLIHAANRSGHM